MSETVETVQPVDVCQARMICNCTSAPWKRDGYYLLDKDGASLLEAREGQGEFRLFSDAEFCVAARTLLPLALDEIERLRAQVEYFTRAIRLREGYKPTK